MSTKRPWKSVAVTSGHGEAKVRISEEANVPCEVFDLQASTQEAIGKTEADCYEECADSEGECFLFKGKDRHDTHGSLSLGFGESSGRVDVPVSVGASLSAEKFCRSWTVCRPRYPWLLRRENDFCEGGGSEHSVTPGHGAHCVGDLLDCTEDVWVTYNGKLVQPGDTIGHES